jgi:glycerol-3-phosphate acyltransferase PlsX
MKPIALDAMGGDHMPEAAVEGALEAQRQGVEVVLVGDEARLASALRAMGGTLELHHAPDVIAMDEDATDVRRRKDASIVRAMQLVKMGEASACVSMGHSGATMAAALLFLGRIDGVERPAILAQIPSDTGFVALLDVGANAECRPAHLQQFAVMGSIYARTIMGKAAPKVGLVSIGEEEEKGNALVKATHALLKATPGIDFYGNVEGRDLFKGTTDVMVTDGFTGNVMLKLAEGEAKVLFAWIRAALTGGSLATKLGAALVKPALKKLAARLDPAEYGAQPLLGVEGYAFIGHGSADARAVASALKTAKEAVEAEVVGKLREGLDALASKRGSDVTLG